MNEQKRAAPSESIVGEEHEPLLIKYVSSVSGHMFDHYVVDHLPDMQLIFYCGGGTAPDRGRVFRTKVPAQCSSPRSPQHDFAARRSALEGKGFPILLQSGPILFDRFDRRYREGLDLIIRGAQPLREEPN